VLLGLPAAAVAHASTAHTAIAQHSSASTVTAPPPGHGAPGTATLSASLVLSVHGLQQRITLTGAGRTTPGTPLVVAGHPAIPVLVNCQPLTGNSPVLGRVQVTMEGPQDAWLMENSQASPFPAEEVLPVNARITMSALPGQSFVIAGANSGPVVLHTPSITNFELQARVFQLAGTAQLEAMNRPGQALATVQSLQVTVKPTGMMPPGQHR